MGDESAGRYWPMGDCEIRYFNGNLFSDRKVYDLGSMEKAALLSAAEQNWQKVEPAIFGTFLEQALDVAEHNGVTERDRLGAHYTPRAYVERLVDATMMDVLRAEWEPLLLKAREAADAGDPKAAIAIAEKFQARIASLRILDPACGTGNFLFVAQERLLQLESEILVLLASLGAASAPVIGPHQFLGLELNARAAVIAEITVWIGWLRFRMAADSNSITDPVLGQTASINFGRHGGYDALLVLNEYGSPDLANPRPAPWPEADFIVGNPPFIGGKDLRSKLDSGYAEALWAANPRVPASADLVMQWWDRAAEILTTSSSPLIRFGFVTTNSITQSFSRRVIEARLAPSSPPSREPRATAGQPEKGGAGGGSSEPPASPDPTGAPTPSPSLEGRGAALSLVFAIPDHPWTKATKDAAAVRIAMTVAEAGAREGQLLAITREAKLDTDEPLLETSSTKGRINADLSVGTDVAQVLPLLANEGICSRGVALHGAGFIVSPAEAALLGLGKRAGLEAHIRAYRHGRDLLQRPRGVMVIDLFGLPETEVRQCFPEVYEHLLKTVREDRIKQVGKSPTTDAKAYLASFWTFGKPRPELRKTLHGLPRYIATVETAKHRIFVFLDATILPDNMLVAIGSDSAFHLGVLSSSAHLEWTYARSSLLGVASFEQGHRYNKTQCFDPFPFPDATPAQAASIAAIAEELDSTRKQVLADHPDLTMTGLYNLRGKIRSGETLTPAEQADASRARARILDHLHETLDDAVAAAYGWEWPLPPAEIIARLVALNATRAAEEKAGTIRYLRPDYQAPGA